VYRWFARFRDDGMWETINHHLVMRDRERVGRKAGPSAAVLDSQSTKTAEAGGPRGYGMHVQLERPPIGVHKRVPLAAADLLARIVDGDTGCVGHLRACVGTIGEHPLDEGKRPARGLQQWHGAVAILDVGSQPLPRPFHFDSEMASKSD
jgi:hypothetical protein